MRWAAEFRNYDIYIYIYINTYIYIHTCIVAGGVLDTLGQKCSKKIHFTSSDPQIHPDSSIHYIYIYNIQIFQHLRDIPGTFQRAPQPKHLREQAQCSLPGARPTAGGQTGGATDGVRLKADPGNIQQQMMDLL